MEVQNLRARIETDKRYGDSYVFKDQTTFRDAIDELGSLLGLGQQEVLTLASGRNALGGSARQSPKSMNESGYVFPPRTVFLCYKRRYNDVDIGGVIAFSMLIVAPAVLQRHKKTPQNVTLLG